MHTVFALLCFVVVIHWLIFPYPPDLLRWHCGNLAIAPVPAKQPWSIWINTSCEIIMNDYITTTKQNTTKPCAYLLGYTVVWSAYLLIERLFVFNYMHDWYNGTSMQLNVGFCCRMQVVTNFCQKNNACQFHRCTFAWSFRVVSRKQNKTEILVKASWKIRK